MSWWRAASWYKAVDGAWHSTDHPLRGICKEGPRYCVYALRGGKLDYPLLRLRASRFGARNARRVGCRESLRAAKALASGSAE